MDINQIEQEALLKYPVCMVQGEGGYGHEVDENQWERAAYKAGRLKSIEEITVLRKINVSVILERNQYREAFEKNQQMIERLKDLISTAHAVGYQSGYKSGSNHDSTEVTANKSWQQFRTENNL